MYYPDNVANFKGESRKTRTLVLTQDTQLTVEFLLDQCLTIIDPHYIKLYDRPKCLLPEV